MKHFICLFLSLTSLRIHAQQTVISEPEKLGGKTPNSIILGKNNEGIMIYRYGKGVDMVESFSSNMALRWKKSLNIKQENSSILKIILYPAKTLAFFLSQSKGSATVFAQRMNSKFVGDGKFLAVDTFASPKNEIANDIKVVHSQNRAQLALYYPEVKDGKLSAIKVDGLNSEIDIRYKVQITVPSVVSTYQLSGVVPDNNGNLVLLFESRERGRRKMEEREFRSYYYKTATNELQEIPFVLDKPIFGNVALEMDNVNNRIVLCGFFSHPGEKKDARGYFYESYDLNENKIQTPTYTDFSPELMFQITGKDADHGEKGLYSFHIRQVILRHDGGPLVIAESQFTNTENIELPSFGPTVGPNIRTVKVNYFNDILVLSLLPTGVLDWYNLLRKKQVSEEDEGFYSSFCTVITDDKLHFIYNDEIYAKTNVNQYMVDSTGKQERAALFNSGDRDIMLAPTIAKQISSNEILIPSFRKNTVRFVKVNL